MTHRTTLAAAALLLLVSGAIFHFLASRLAQPLFAVGVHPDVLGVLEASLDDQRRLASGDPDNEPSYRRRFDDTRALLGRLKVLEHSRADLERRYRQIVTFAFAAAAMLAVGGVVLRQGRQEKRLTRIRSALADLAAGRTDIDLGERRRDTLGKIATMIEQTSRVMARDRKRLASLQNLSAWQESARRHAHEMRTPLTGARLELTRLDGLLAAEPLSRPDEVRDATRSVTRELERLGSFTRAFTSFARVPRPRLERSDLASLVAELASTFASAWPNLNLRFEPPAGETAAAFEAMLDRDMVRRVLVNLCDNSSLALGERRGTVTLTLASSPKNVFLEVADDGPGIDARVLPRLFEPYTTSRSIGEGMGLGLAISKKVLLDLGGDLELAGSSEKGAAFRLTFDRHFPEDAS